LPAGAHIIIRLTKELARGILTRDPHQAVHDDVSSSFSSGGVVHIHRRVHDESRDGDADVLAVHGEPRGGHRRAFFLGLVADRYFATEKVLASCTSWVVLSCVPCRASLVLPPRSFLLLLVYNLCYMPTLVWRTAWRSTTSITGAAVPADPRVWTIGWIVAGLFISLFLGK